MNRPDVEVNDTRFVRGDWKVQIDFLMKWTVQMSSWLPRSYQVSAPIYGHFDQFFNKCRGLSILIRHAGVIRYFSH